MQILIPFLTLLLSLHTVVMFCLFRCYLHSLQWSQRQKTNSENDDRRQQPVIHTKVVTSFSSSAASSSASNGAPTADAAKAETSIIQRVVKTSAKHWNYSSSLETSPTCIGYSGCLVRWLVLFFWRRSQQVHTHTHWEQEQSSAREQTGKTNCRRRRQHMKKSRSSTCWLIFFNAYLLRKLLPYHCNLSIT